MHVFVESRIKEAQALSDTQLAVRIACEKELLEWRELQIERLQEEQERSRERLYSAAAVLHLREVGKGTS